MITINLIDELTDEVFTTVELEDETVKMIKKCGMTIEEGVKKALTEMVLMYEKDPKGFKKLIKKSKKESKSP